MDEGVRERAAVRIETERLVLTIPSVPDIPRILAFYERNRDHFGRWEPDLPEDFMTAPYWRDRLARFQREERENVSLRLFLFPRGDEVAGPILGLVSFTRLFALPIRRAQLGYALDAAREGTGLMTEALVGALDYVTRVRGLRRVTATYQLDNTRSARVLERLGFKGDRILPRHLFTAGAWRDHALVYREFP